jgi:hypothetical protein
VDAAAAAGGGGGRRRRRGDYLSMSCVELRWAGRRQRGGGGSTFVLLAGEIWLLARSHTSHHNRHVVVVLNPYVD